MPEPVIAGALVGIREDRVGLGRLLELLLGVRVAGVLVRVQLVREPPVRGLDRLSVGGALDAEDLVVISLLHVFQGPSAAEPPATRQYNAREGLTIRAAAAPATPALTHALPTPEPRRDVASCRRPAAVDGVGDPVRAPLQAGERLLMTRASPPSSTPFSGAEVGVDLGEVVRRERARVLLEALLGRVDEPLGVVPEVGELLLHDVVGAVRLRVADHPLDLLLGEAGGAGDPDLLLLAGAEVLRRHVHDAVGVDVERHLDLRHAARRGRDADELEARERLVVGRHLALALEDVDRDERLVVDRGREDLRLLHGTVVLRSMSLVEDRRPRLDAERERRDVEEEDVLHLARQHAALDGGADRDDLVGVDALVRLLAEDSATTSCTGGMRVMPPTRITSSICFTVTPASSSAVRHGSSVRSTRSPTQLLERGALDRLGEVHRAGRVGGDERQVDLGLARRWRARAWPAPPPP